MERMPSVQLPVCPLSFQNIKPHSSPRSRLLGRLARCGSTSGIARHSEVAASWRVTSVTYGSQTHSLRILRGVTEVASAFKNLDPHACLPHGGGVAGVRPTPTRLCSRSC